MPRTSSTLRTRTLVALIAATLAASGGSALAQARQPKSKESLKKEGEKLFGPGKEEKAAAKDSGTWSIIIEGFRGEDQEDVARQALAKVQTEGGLKNAYIEKRGAATVVALGHFASGESTEAKNALARVRGTKVVIAGIETKPFANSFLAPPANIPGSVPEYDLRQAKKRQGDWVLYTLQIGVYTRRDKPATAAEMAEFRKMAELAVSQLRREGEQAFYYHGPTGSMVTIGLFGAEDFDPQTPGVESPVLSELRKRYPYNLLNGQGMKESVTVTTDSGKQAKSTRLQPSSLVAVPRSE